MYKRYNSLLSFLFLFGGVFVVMPFISSCGKSGTTGPSSNIQYQIINVSPGLGSVDLYVNYIKVNTSSYFYPTPSGYFYLNSTILPFQIRPGTTLVPGTTAPSANFFVLNDTLKPNTRYTLIITGIKPDSTYIFLTDTSSSPSRGRGKIRFVNASPGSTGFDITANDTSLFSNVAYTKYSAYKEVPAGTYEFKMYPTGTSTLLRDVTNVTIQDGRLYTLYCYGLANHTADTLAFSSGFITNK
jgi:hypothetical protein